jgi:hypothetical protein
LVLTHVVNKAIACDQPIPDITDQTYIDRSMLLGAAAREKEPMLRMAWDELFNTYPVPVRPVHTGVLSFPSCLAVSAAVEW